MDGLTKKDVARIAKRARKRIGMSKLEFALLFGKSVNSITAWENGKVKDRDTLEVLKAIIEHNGKLPDKKVLKHYRTFAQTGKYFELFTLLKVLFEEQKGGEEKE